MAVGVIVWSETAATNANADTSVNWAEGMAPSAVNDSARAEMASVAKWRDDLNATLLASGVSTALTLTTNQVQGALTAGYEATFTTTFDIGTPATISVDSLTAKPLRRAPNTEVLTNQYRAGVPLRMSYFTSNSGEWILEAGHSPVVKTQVITTTATTYTPTTGMSYAVLECVGGGGGGGGAGANAGGQDLGGGGGGGGGYARKIVSATSITSSQVVTVGAGATATTSTSGSDGGDSSVGSLCIGKGGIGGAVAVNNTLVSGGAGGVAGTGDFTVPGQSGLWGGKLGTADWGGGGGMSGLGFGTGSDIVMQVASAATTGKNGRNFGSGGGGAGNNGQTAATPGGAGAPGIVVITEYI